MKRGKNFSKLWKKGRERKREKSNSKKGRDY